jgi:hypothetical protein
MLHLKKLFQENNISLFYNNKKLKMFFAHMIFFISLTATLMDSGNFFHLFNNKITLSYLANISKYS